MQFIDFTIVALYLSDIVMVGLVLRRRSRPRTHFPERC